MVEISFFPLDISHKTRDGRSYAYLYGRTTEGKQVCVVKRFEPYFYVKTEGDSSRLIKELKDIRLEYKGKEVRIAKTEEIDRKHLDKKVKLIKIFTGVPEEKKLLKRKLAEAGLNCFEYNLSSVSQYLRDEGIVPMALVKAEGDYKEEKSRVPVFKAEKLEQEGSEAIDNLRVLSFDIETYAKEKGAIIPEKNPILMISFYGMQEEKPFKKVITWKKFKTELDYIEFTGSEQELIIKFKEVIKTYRPDILTGYFSDGFDLPYLRSRADIYGINLNLGHDYSNLALKRREEHTCRFTGLIHLDIFKFVRNIISRGLRTESLSLNAVAKELLGDKKHDADLNKLAQVWDSKPEELEEFCKYNLHDSYLAYELCIKLMPSLQELVKLAGIPLFELSRISFSRLVENYILKRSREFNILAANKPSPREVEWRRGRTYEGGFVYEPKPGMYENLAVFDFRSLYPTIIASHNIGPDTLNCKCCKDEEKVPGKDYWFCRKKKGFFSKIVEDLVSRRLRVKEMIRTKKEKNEESKLLEARSYGLKTTANAFYGYMGFFAARWYSLECVQSITAYARDYIKKTMNKAKEKGFEVVYGDTDSLMVVLKNKSREEALDFLKEINANLPEFMELELEGFYPRGLFVSVKGTSYGAKKKYALFDGEKVHVIGFEAVRRNWSKIAKETQDNVLQIILKENDAEKALAYVRGVMDKVVNGEADLSKLIIKTQLTRPIDQYESIGPHVAIAKRMVKKGYEVVPGMVISFIVGKGSGLVRERAKMIEEVSEGEYDSEYYIWNQLVPAVSSIFGVFGYAEDEILKEKEQTALKDFS
jgi:DNA polymerase elongation subunit (family B)